MQPVAVRVRIVSPINQRYALAAIDDVVVRGRWQDSCRASPAPAPVGWRVSRAVGCLPLRVRHCGAAARPAARRSRPGPGQAADTLARHDVHESVGHGQASVPRHRARGHPGWHTDAYSAPVTGLALDVGRALHKHDGALGPAPARATRCAGSLEQLAQGDGAAGIE